MQIKRADLDDALMGNGNNPQDVIDKIREALKKGDRVIVDKQGGHQSLLEDDPAKKGKFKTTPIAKK